MGADNPRDRGRDRRQPLIRRLGWWAWFTVRGFFRDRGVDRSAALAYITLLALVPLLAVVASLSRSFFSSHTEDIVRIFSIVLPYSPDAVAKTLTEFIRRARTLGGIGFLIFVVLGFRLFLLVEEMLNDVWRSPSRRSVTMRIFSFTMVLFWGPVVMGLGTTFLFWLGRQPWAPDAALVLGLTRLAIPFVGFTMVYLLAPHTPVRVGAAVTGGLTATVALQVLRSAFVAYIRAFPNINLIYGSLALVVFFLISLFAFWVLVIVGAEASYVSQNLGALLRERAQTRGGEPDAVLTPILLLLACYRHVRLHGEPPTLHALSEVLGTADRTTGRHLQKLVNAGLVAVTGGERESYLPIIESGRLTLGEAVERIWPLKGTPPPGYHPEVVGWLVEILGSARRVQRELLDPLTFDELVSLHEEEASTAKDCEATETAAP